MFYSFVFLFNFLHIICNLKKYELSNKTADQLGLEN